MSAKKAKKPSRKAVKVVKKPSRKTVKVVKKAPAKRTKRKKRIIPFISNHTLALNHSKLSQKELNIILEKYQITRKELPKMRRDDPAIRDMKLEEGDVVKIKRDSLTAGEIFFFREVVNV